uniref:Uncharacterized protein n=1 Tax=Panstrongylus lignarius TaxID=156445 RepID=A0A224XVH0_9HEMI
MSQLHLLLFIVLMIFCVSIFLIFLNVVTMMLQMNRRILRLPQNSLQSSVTLTFNSFFCFNFILIIFFLYISSLFRFTCLQKIQLFLCLCW